MTAFIPGLIIGFLLALFALSLLIFLVALHRPRYQSLTLHGRREREKEVAVQPAQEEGGVRYEFMNLTGLEDR